MGNIFDILGPVMVGQPGSVSLPDSFLEDSRKKRKFIFTVHLRLPERDTEQIKH